MQAEAMIRELPKGLLSWYPLEEGMCILHVTEKSDSITEFLLERGINVVCTGIREIMDEKFCEKYAYTFDAIIAVSVLEQMQKPKQLLCSWRMLLKEKGKLLLGTENRFGFRYFCGDRDPCTGRNFDGIENYRSVEMIGDNSWRGRCYARFEIEEMLDNAGFHHRKFYAVLPDLKYPQMIFSEDFQLNEELETRYFPMYNYPDAVFLEEEMVYTDLIRNGMLGQMANTYLIECCPDNIFAGVEQVTLSMDRGPEYAVATIIRSDGRVEKRAVYPEGRKRLQNLIENSEDLKKHGLNVVDGWMQGDSYIMPYVKGEVALSHLRKLLYQNRELFITEMDHFRDQILKSSEIKETEDGTVFKKGYFDLVPLNCFYTEEGYQFYDQEFCLEDYPVNTILTRMIDLTYMGDKRMEHLLPREVLFKRYGLLEQVGKWRRDAGQFLSKLRNERQLRVFYEQHRKNAGSVHSNRQRINFSVGDYQRLFVNIFNNIGSRKLILFGSGSYTGKFLEVYAKEYPVSLILDNNPDKWGTQIMGIPIESPSILNEMSTGEYKILICIKNYIAVMHQLQNMGINDFGIFDISMDYPINREGKGSAVSREPADVDATQKKYRTGYIAGVFDLFHVGHLNMFRRAKEQCDYLIVGVVSDEGVRRNKKTETFIPFKERIEMVRSCRYVDEAVEIPLNYGGTRDAFRLYHFDCQFSGSDYIDNPDWLAEKLFLEKNGAEMVFFPYTETTSSSKIKKLINEKLV